jgi:hypothetical protein
VDGGSIAPQNRLQGDGRRRVLLPQLGDSEVEDLQVTVLVDAQIGWLEVAMQEVLLVRRGESFGDLYPEADHFALGKPPSLQDVAQSLAGDVFHDDEIPVILHEIVLDARDTRLIEHAEEIGFAAKGFACRVLSG